MYYGHPWQLDVARFPCFGSFSIWAFGQRHLPILMVLAIILGLVNFDHYINQIENANLRILHKRILQGCVSNKAFAIVN